MNVHQVISGVLGIWTFLSPQIFVMWEKPCHKPPITRNGNHTTYKNGDDWGMVYDIALLTLLVFALMIFIQTPRSPMCPMPYLVESCDSKARAIPKTSHLLRTVARVFSFRGDFSPHSHGNQRAMG